MLSNSEIAGIFEHTADILEQNTYDPSDWMSGTKDNCTVCEVGAFCLAMGGYYEDEPTGRISINRVHIQHQLEQALIKLHPTEAEQLGVSLFKGNFSGYIAAPSIQHELWNIDVDDINDEEEYDKKYQEAAQEAKKRLIAHLRQRAAELTNQPAEEIPVKVEEERSPVVA